MPMSVEPLGSGRATALPADHAVLSAQDFWKLLLTQLQMQDPFTVGDTQAMLQQFVSLQSAQTATEVAEGLKRVQALLMLGREIQALIDGQWQTGVVVRVAFGEDQPNLLVQLGSETKAVPLSTVSAIAIPQSGGDGRWA
jgi:hypothetical protein